MDYVLPIRMLGRLFDVKVWSRKERGMSDHFLVEDWLKLEEGWRCARRMEDVRNVLKVSELNNREREMTYQENLDGKYEVWRGGEVKSVEKEWGKSGCETGSPSCKKNDGPALERAIGELF